MACDCVGQKASIGMMYKPQDSYCPSVTPCLRLAALLLFLCWSSLLPQLPRVHPCSPDCSATAPWACSVMRPQTHRISCYVNAVSNTLCLFHWTNAGSGRQHFLLCQACAFQCWKLFPQGGRSYQTGKLHFHNNYALNEEIGGMPETDFTVEMWVRTPEYSATAEAVQRSELLSYATHTVGDSSGGQHCKSAFLHNCYGQALLPAL